MSYMSDSKQCSNRLELYLISLLFENRGVNPRGYGIYRVNMAYMVKLGQLRVNITK